MKLFAISDIHLGYEDNRRAFSQLAHRPNDWLILAGDIGETIEQLEFALDVACARFAQVLWVPGNHELWVQPTPAGPLRGLAKYEALVRVCRARGVATPEDPYLTWSGPGGPCVLAPIFTLYDYSFGPEGVTRDEAVSWATESGVLCADEAYLDPHPFSSRETWCAARCRETEARLELASRESSTVLIGHFPLRRDVVRIPRIPRFVIWCGSLRTQDWHRRFRAKVVVSGHLHVRATDWIDGVRFEEVSLGYPRQWWDEAGTNYYLREILPGDEPPAPGQPTTIYRR